MPVNTPHAEYLAAAPVWADLRAAYAGPRLVKAAGIAYLPKPLGMRRAAQYAAYQFRATVGGWTERVVHGLTGAVMRKEPDLAVPEAMVPQLEDVTQSGVPWRTFAAQAVMDTLLMGRLGVLVDFPQPVAVGSSPMPGAALRPYWVAYAPEEIVNWRTIQRQGDTVLSLVVLAEHVSTPGGVWPSPDFFVTQTRRQYRVLRLNETGHYEVSIWVPVGVGTAARVETFQQVDQWMPMRNGVPLDFLPFSFVAPFSVEPPVQKSLLEGLIEIHYRSYRHSADYEHALHLTSLPTPWVAADMETPQQLLIGSAEAWLLPKGSTANLLEYHGQGLQPHEHAMERDMQDMAALGARLLEGAPLVAETATAVLRRTQGTDSPMQSLVTSVSHGLTQALQIHAWWGGFTANVDDTHIHLTLNSDLVSAALDAPLLTSLMQMLLNNTISFETFYYNLQRGDIARPMTDVEEEQALIELRQLSQPLIATLPATNGARNGVPSQG